MATLIDRHGPPNLRRTRNAFASLGRSIIHQQLSTKSAAAIYRRFLGHFPRGRFPSPEMLAATSAAQLRAVGLSAAKAAYLHDLAARFADGTLTPRRFAAMTDVELAEVLMQVKGIGPWSVDMFLLFGLCRRDILPVGDLGVKQGMKLYFDLEARPSAAEMRVLAAQWQPYRSFASWYMWRLLEDGMP